MTAGLQYLRARYHPLHHVRSVTVLRRALAVVDVPCWISLPMIPWKLRVRAVRHASYVVLRGSPEPGLTAFLRASIDLFEPASFWDIGANFGYYGFLAKSIRPELSVTFCEPDSGNASLVRATIDRSARLGFTLCELAVSDARGSAMFSTDSVTGATGTLESGESSFAHRHWQGGPSIRVPTSTVDALAQSDDVSIVKIDVEGHEEQVIAGALGTIAHCKPIIFFECFHGATEIARALDPLDYLLLDVESGAAPTPTTDNYVALPATAQAQLPALMRRWRALR